MVTIISTHPVSVRYNKWEENAEMHTKTRVWDCTIPGGAGILDKKSLQVPDGVATEITDEALEKLMSIPDFVNDIAKGYIKVLKNRRKTSVDASEEAKKDMNTEGSGKQITDKDFEADGAVINEDGSIDISDGGENVVARKSAEFKARRGGRGRKHKG